MLKQLIASVVLLLNGAANGHSLISQLPNLVAPDAASTIVSPPVSAPEVQVQSLLADFDRKIEGISDAEMFFKYKTEKSYQGKVKMYSGHLFEKFDARLAMALANYTDEFTVEFNQAQAVLWQNQDKGERPEVPKTMESLNKTWQDIIVLVSTMGELHANLSNRYKYEMEQFFHADDKDEGHDKLSKIFFQHWDEFVGENEEFLKEKLPKMKSLVKQNKVIDKLTNKMMKDVKAWTKEDLEPFELSLLKMAEGEVQGILVQYVNAPESHTHWKEQTKNYFDSIWPDDEKKPKMLL